MRSTSLFVFILLIAGQLCKAQELTEINVRVKPGTFTIHSIVFTLNGIDLYINSTGNISPVNIRGRRMTGWPVGVADSLNDEYYDNFESDEKVGKLKSINGITIDYYDKFSNQEKVGKIRSIGKTRIDYYDNFDNNQKTGKIKSIGNISIDYFDSFDRDEKKGKMKSFGNYTINYYDLFDGDEKTGKLKTFGPITIEYYDRYSNDSKISRVRSIRGNTQSLYVTVAGKWK